MYLKRIKELRQSQSRSQVNVSTLLGIDQSYYSKLELGKHDISLDTLIKIADLYNVSLDYLTERTNNREINK
ncbi:MAG: helix-turn-helix transcriptional regulator [Clostridiales bacterium]|uniref:Helix-turn-helix transcriptional regulator n=1 Tax=Candidatus Scybalenecus merdavium TaxID=2840939 RepID=A0A9D1MT82_9FIRM|nr:helix-turn-helix transcriptional regulator [Clostridiales bacterium]HIU68338.1 helix-turn-helix transcriptional regulator [Candidatus Scubalenecus merdavium]